MFLKGVHVGQRCKAC